MWERLIDLGNGPANNNLYVGFDRGITVGIRDGSGAGQWLSTNRERGGQLDVFPTGSWHHVAVSHDSSTLLNIYVDGARFTEQSTASTTRGFRRRVEESPTSWLSSGTTGPLFTVTCSWSM